MTGALPAALGFATLLGTGAALAGGTYLVGLWQDVTRPPRRAMGWALGQGLPSSPEDLGLQFRERTHAFPGCTMPAWWITGRAPASRRAVVILHGHGRSRWDSLRRVGPWIDQAALVVMPDLRGHGDAPGRSALARREPTDVCALIAEIEAEHPGITITLVGHSLGAVVAIHAAAARAAGGAPIDAVVAWGPYDRVRTPFEARLRLRGLPARPFSTAILKLIDRLDGPETPTHEAAAAAGATRLTIHADDLDMVSPTADALAIAAANPAASIARSCGIPHADLGT